MSEAPALDGPRRSAAEAPATALVVLLHGFGADAARGNPGTPTSINRY